MLTREQIEEIQTERREKGISIKNLLKEKRNSRAPVLLVETQIHKPEVPEGFLQVAGGGLPATMAAQLPGTIQTLQGKSKSDTTGENWMSIELRTAGGTDMRIQGGLTPAMVYTILKSL